MYSEFILGIPTNATRALQYAERLAGKVAYINVGLAGPRAIPQRVRGDYDKVMADSLCSWNTGCRCRGGQQHGTADTVPYGRNIRMRGSRTL